MEDYKKFELHDEALDSVAGGAAQNTTEHNGITYTKMETVTLPGSCCGCGKNGNLTTGLLVDFRMGTAQIQTHCCGRIVYCDFSQVTK